MTVADPAAATGSAPYEPVNLLDRLSAPDTLQAHYDYLAERERALLARLGLRSGRVLSVGCGWHPGRHLFPAPAFHLTAVDADPAPVTGVLAEGSADEAFVGHAGRLGLAAESFDVVLYRLVLHHVAFRSPLTECFEEAARLLVRGGAMVAIEPGLWHPVGLALAAANHVGLATAIHGTPDDIPLSPRRLCAEARRAGLEPRLYAVSYSWRRLPQAAQRALRPLDAALGPRARTARFGHTLMLLARKPG